MAGESFIDRQVRAHTSRAAGLCGCWTCLRERDEPRTFMILCPICGCKRCPKATDHRLACTESNEPGQEGSAYSVAGRAALVALAQPTRGEPEGRGGGDGD